MASSQAMQWTGDQHRILPQTDAAVLASGRLQSPSVMWQPGQLSSAPLGTAPTSAAMATDHPALGFSMLQNRMNVPLKQEPGQTHALSGSAHSWNHPFSSMPPFACDYGALNPMPVVPASSVLSAMNHSSATGQEFPPLPHLGGAGAHHPYSPRALFASFRTGCCFLHKLATYFLTGFWWLNPPVCRTLGQFEPAGSQFYSSSGLISLPNSFGMSGANSYSALQSSVSFDTFSQLNPKSFGADAGMPRPASMPSLMGGPVQFEPGTGMPVPGGRRKVLHALGLSCHRNKLRRPCFTSR
jgi:hypothetical protein